MGEFVKLLPGLGGIGIDLPVVDKTGLEGPWDFHLDVRLAPPPGSATGAIVAGPGPGSTDGPTIFEAVEQIGLKLEPRKVPVPVLVVDHLAMPTEN
jgi:uncharacterized protein (TIGR03435 family)